MAAGLGIAGGFAVLLSVVSLFALARGPGLIEASRGGWPLWVLAMSALILFGFVGGWLQAAFGEA